MNDLYSTAIHEAGHAVIGRVLGMVCGDVTIHANDAEGTAGYSIIADPYVVAASWEAHGRVRAMASVFRGRIMSYMAGRLAEEECLGIAGVGDWDDRAQIADQLDEADVPNWRSGAAAFVSYEARLRERARGLVLRHRRVIERVAESLMAKSALTSAEVDGIMRREHIAGSAP